MTDTINITNLKINTFDLSLVVNMAAKLECDVNYMNNTSEDTKFKNHMALIRVIEQIENAENNGVPVFVGTI